MIRLGLISVDKESIENTFKKNISVFIVIGGAAEALGNKEKINLNTN